jgi:hypothetical protein
MAKYRMIAFSRPIEGRENDYNEWYQNVHMPQVVSLDGFVSARRYKLAQHLQGEASLPYAAIYKIETDDLGTMLGHFVAAAKSGQLRRSDAVDYAASQMGIFEEFGEEALHGQFTG